MPQFYRSPRVGIILTGASRGFGVALAKTFAQHYRETFPRSTAADAPDEGQLTFILLARNAAQLQLVAEQLRLIDSRIKVHCIECDLSKVEAIGRVQEFLRGSGLGEESIGHFVLLHNAGSIGDAHLRCRSISARDAAHRDAYYRLNVFSVMELTALFLELTESTTRHVVNISSLAAIQPFTGLVDYCMGKASREAYFRSLVHELAEDKVTSTRVLNYAPGPLETDMFNTLRSDSLVSEAFQQIVPLTTEQSAERLMKVLLADSYADGAHVDYYDVE